MNEKNKQYMYFVFRVLVGLGFFLHGGMKLFGWFGGINGSTVKITSLMGLAGIIEFFGGAAIALGLFTSIAAIFSALVMIGAWATVHIKQGINPLTNGGELAMLYFAAFLVLIAWGAGPCSLEKQIWGKEYMHESKK